MAEPIIIETERLLLRPVGLEDAAFVLELVNTPKWLQNIGDRNIHTLEEAEEYIKARYKAQENELGFCNFVLLRKEDGMTIGNCGIYNREGVEGVDIGFSLLPQFEKMGYAYEASSRIRDFAIETLNLKKISGITIKENIPSRNLLEKLGLTFKKNIRIPNDDANLMLFEMEIE
ncbi:MAG: GNAT family N-acetyltransferase [Saprospiraceae bacterium]